MKDELGIFYVDHNGELGFKNWLVIGVHTHKGVMYLILKHKDEL